MVHIAALFGMLLFTGCYTGFFHKKKALSPMYAGLVFGAAFLLRLFAAAGFTGFDSDISCFAAWGERIFETGPAGFYSPEVFTDYPPGYMYILYALGALRSLFHIPYLSPVHVVLLKLPAILCDLGCGYLLYKEAGKRCLPSQSILLCAAWLFNPSVILNSALWGQIDSLLALCAALLCLCLVKGKTVRACVVFCVGILIKPQILFLAPVLLGGLLDYVFFRGFSRKKLAVNLAGGLFSLLCTAALCLPFGLKNVWEQYFSTLDSYPYAAVNACNFWGMLGLNWSSQNNAFLGLSCRGWGFLLMLGALLSVLALSLRRRLDNEKYPFLGALMILSIFVFSVRMHERYLFPALFLLLLAYAYQPVSHVFSCYGLFSLLHFYNGAYVLFFYDPAAYDPKAPLLLIVSAGMVLSALYLFFFAAPCYFPQTCSDDNSSPEGLENGNAHFPEKLHSGSVPLPSEQKTPLKRADLLCILFITLVYGCFALYDLGDRKAPETAYEMTYGDTIELDFGNHIPTSLSYYIAPWHKPCFALEGTQAPAPQALGTVTLENVFTWQEVELPGGYSRLRFTLEDSQASLLELVFKDGGGNVILPVNAGEYPALFDEQALYPAHSSFRNSMYFDEIYHGRTAYEFLHGLTAYENTHPPLGKVFISLGVACFGMNPFGWRIVGTLFGIAMVPLVYLFARKLTCSVPASALACMLFSFDFMHFSQTRIATIDVYITFFVMLMYYFLFRYSRVSFYDTPLKKTFLPLGACGVSMGLGIACKWTGVYAGAGMAFIFFALLFRRYREYKYALTDPEGESRGISHAHIIESFLPCACRTCLFCLIFFVLIPGIIYLLSYLPFVDYNESGLLARMLKNQVSMFRYHSTLEAVHPYSSAWYEWPVIRRPIWYFSSIVTGSAGKGGLREGISAFGNPLVWWPGIIASLCTAFLWIQKKDRTAAFLTVGYLAQYLPWFFVTRVTFIYHYFPSVVFVVLMITYCLLTLRRRLSSKGFNALCVLYGAAAFGLFLLFYPVLSGQPVDAGFVDKWLRWFDSWVLVAG